MPLRNWLFHPPVGVGLGIVALLLVAGLNNHYNEASSGKHKADHHLTYGTNSGSQPGVAVVGNQQPPPRNPHPDRDEWRAESDLETQQKMAQWTLWSMIAALLGFGATIVGIYYVKRTLDATRDAVLEAGKATKAAEEAVRVTRESAEHQMRAYVHVVGVQYESVESGPHDARAIIQIKNYGQTPAYDLVFWHDSAVREVPITGEEIRSYAQNSPKCSLAPGATMTYYQPLNFVTFDTETRDAIEFGQQGIYVFGSATYRDAFIEKPTRVTAFRLVYTGADAVRTGKFAIYQTGNKTT